MLKSLIWNCVKQCIQLVHHIWIPECGLKILFLTCSWLNPQMQNLGIWRANYISFEKIPHVSQTVQFKSVLCKDQLYLQLLPLPFDPAQGSYLPKLSSGQVTGTGKNPWQLWTWSWASPSAQYSICWAASPLGFFQYLLYWLQKWWLKPSALQTPLNLKLLLGR